MGAGVLLISLTDQIIAVKLKRGIHQIKPEQLLSSLVFNKKGVAKFDANLNYYIPFLWQLNRDRASAAK